MKRAVILVVALIAVSAWVGLAAGATPAQLTEEVRAFGLTIVATLIAGSLLALYFNWRERFVRGFPADYDTEDGLEAG